MNLMNPVILAPLALVVSFVLFLVLQSSDEPIEKAENVDKPQTDPKISLADDDKFEEDIVEKYGILYPNRFGKHYRRVYRAGYGEGYKDGTLDQGG